MSTGSLTQLAALGSQDQYLSVAGEITFFKGVYRRHTNFAKESVFMNFNQTPTWGGSTTCVISRTGDLLSKCWLQLTIPALNVSLDYDDFFKFKEKLMGPDVKLMDSAGVPVAETKEGSLNGVKYQVDWTYPMNISKYYPTKDGTKFGVVDVDASGISYQSVPKELNTEARIKDFLGDMYVETEWVDTNLTKAADAVVLQPDGYPLNGFAVPVGDSKEKYYHVKDGNESSTPLYIEHFIPFGWTKFRTDLAANNWDPTETTTINAEVFLSEKSFPVDQGWVQTTPAIRSHFGFKETTSAHFLSMSERIRSDIASNGTAVLLPVKDLLVNGITTGPGAFIWKQGQLDKDTFNNSIDLQKEFITNNPGKFPKARYCDEVGHAMIKKVELVIGGTLIDSHPGHYLQVWNELTQTPEKKQIAHLIGRSGSEEELQDLAMEDQKLYVPLQFFFCRHLMCSLPLIALQYHQVEIKVEFAKLTDVVAFNGYHYPFMDTGDNGTNEPSALNLQLGHTASHYEQREASLLSGNNFVKVRADTDLEKDVVLQEGGGKLKCSLMCNLIYLEEEERKTFAGSTHEYLVDLLQYQGPQSCTNKETTYHAYFNHPTSELIWTLVPYASIKGGEPFNYTALQSSYNAAGDTMKKAKLQFNGYDRFQEMDAAYFREIIPAQYHTSVPTRPVYVYSFALEPEDFRPSGSVNLSRIDNVKLVVKHVDFSPSIKVAPFIATDAVNDSMLLPNGMSLSMAKMKDRTVRNDFNSIMNPVSGGTGYYGAIGTQFSNNKASNGLMDAHSQVQRHLLQDMAKRRNQQAVAIHPDEDGSGLFLQLTDGISSQIVPGAELRVYARSKNVLRIKSGMAGLAYAN